MSRARFRPLSVAGLTMQLALAACGGEASVALKAMVGTYSTEKAEQAGPGGQWIRERATLTVRDDHRWTMLREATVDGVPDVSSPDSGTYSLKGATLVLNSPNSGIMQYTLRSDTLWIGASPAQPGAGYLVRER